MLWLRIFRSEPEIGQALEAALCSCVMTLLIQYLRHRAIPTNSGLWICRRSAKN